MQTHIITALRPQRRKSTLLYKADIAGSVQYCRNYQLPQILENWVYKFGRRCEIIQFQQNLDLLTLILKQTVGLQHICREGHILDNFKGSNKSTQISGDTTMVALNQRHKCKNVLCELVQNPFYERYNNIIVWLTLLTNAGLLCKPHCWYILHGRNRFEAVF